MSFHHVTSQFLEHHKCLFFLFSNYRQVCRKRQSKYSVFSSSSSTFCVICESRCNKIKGVLKRAIPQNLLQILPPRQVPELRCLLPRSRRSTRKIRLLPSLPCRSSRPTYPASFSFDYPPVPKPFFLWLISLYGDNRRMHG